MVFNLSIKKAGRGWVAGWKVQVRFLDPRRKREIQGKRKAFSAMLQRKKDSNHARPQGPVASTTGRRPKFGRVLVEQATKCRVGETEEIKLQGHIFPGRRYLFLAIVPSKLR